MAKQPKITLRLTPNQDLLIEEMSTRLKVAKSVLLRTIIGDWLFKNEDYVYRLMERIDKENEQE